jgi:heme/copper-type cytochrome/quinol oxidase subunit 3
VTTLADRTVAPDVDVDLVPAPQPDGPALVVVPPPPAARRRGYGTGFWGMVCVIATESFVFLALLSAYFFLRASSRSWPQGGIRVPDLSPIWIFSLVLLASSLPIFGAESAIRHGRVRALQVGLLVSFLMGSAFLANEGWEWAHLDFSWTKNAYASIFYVVTGLHGAHVLVGLAMNAQVQAKAALGKLSADRHVSMQVFGLYWHFVDAVWIFVFSSLYLSVHLR